MIEWIIIIRWKIIGINYEVKYFEKIFSIFFYKVRE